MVSGAGRGVTSITLRVAVRTSTSTREIRVQIDSRFEFLDLVQQMMTIYENYGFPTQIIVAAVRHPTHVLEAALAGAHVCTMSYDVMKQLYEHPLTEQGVAVFLDDWKKVPGDLFGKSKRSK